jgi:hypothetical protein
MAIPTSQLGESWRHRFLSWIYPAREWASEQRVNELEASVNRARKVARIPAKPVILSAGAAK